MAIRTHHNEMGMLQTLRTSKGAGTVTEPVLTRVEGYMQCCRRKTHMHHAICAMPFLGFAMDFLLLSEVLPMYQKILPHCAARLCRDLHSSSCCRQQPWVYDQNAMLATDFCHSQHGIKHCCWWCMSCLYPTSPPPQLTVAMQQNGQGWV